MSRLRILGRDRGFWVATKLATTKVLYSQRQSWARTTSMCVRLGCVHDRSASATEEFCLVREFSITADLDSEGGPHVAT